MEWINRRKWIVFICWVLIAAGLLATAPNMTELVREKGQITIPEGYPSTIAVDLLKQNSEQDGGISLVLVFHNPEGLSQNDLDETGEAIKDLVVQKEKLGIMELTSHFLNEELTDQLVSEDGHTILTSLKVDLGDRSIEEMRKQLHASLADVNTAHYFTGAALIDEDVVLSSERGLKRTELITLVFIIIVLLGVFRSIVAPFVPLITVGFTYVASQSIVAFLVEHLNFPLSNFTQIFMVVVLFGIGTDYCILLLSRFKEEMSHGHGVVESILKTYKTAGKTVLFSALAALVGFATIGFATFSLFQSAVGVAVGIAVLIIALVTIVPFFMAVLGKSLFWPLKKNMNHPQSKLWGAAGNLSLRRPLISLLIVAAISLPLLWTLDAEVSFDSMNEIGDDYESVKAFNIISDSFSPGETMTSKIVIDSDKAFDSKEGLAWIEKLSRHLNEIETVEKVRSATRPLGDEMKEFDVSFQAETLSEGLGEGTQGIIQIRDGLNEAAVGLQDSQPELQEASGGVQELVAGTFEIKDGIEELETGLQQIYQGVQSGAMGANEIQQGLKQAADNADKLAEAGQQLISSYETLDAGAVQIRQGYQQIGEQLSELTQVLQSLQPIMNTLGERYPELQQDREFLTAQGIIDESTQGLEQLTAGLNELNTNLVEVTAGLQQAHSSFTEVAAGQAALAEGLQQLASGAAELAAGLGQAAEGQQQIVQELPGVTDGLDQLAQGQGEIKQGFEEMTGQLGELGAGLAESVDGLTQISDGLNGASQYLDELAAAVDEDLSGWNMPDEALQSEEFQSVFDVYMQGDRTLTTLEVVFNVNPYAKEAIDSIPLIEASVQETLAGSQWSDAEFGISGVSSTFHDLDVISSADYIRTIIFMLIGIALILIILLRSIVMPIYILFSLVVCYFTAMSVTELVFVNIMGYDGINWTLPFFGFVILTALGVDYSIFLMDRFSEYKQMSVSDAILLAMKNMGTVIISAVIILAGTFAAMYPSGVLSLIQIATFVLGGLLLYSFVFLPLFIPVMVKWFNKANWWPFSRK
jgi:RND superfamily putative drug exporter